MAGGWGQGRELVRRRWRLAGETLGAWEPVLWVVAALAAVALVPLRYEIGQNADGLLQTLMSLQHLTPFFWDQTRFANLLPFLAAPVADPVANAAVQLALRVASGVAAPLFFCAPFVRGWRRAGWATLLATDLALAFAPVRFIHEWFVEASPYGTSFALAGFALLMFGGARGRQGWSAGVLRGSGLALTVAAYLVNASLLIFAGPMFGLLAVIGGSALAAEFGIASVVGCAVTAMAAQLVAAPPTIMRFGETLIGLTYYLGQLARKPGLFVAAMVVAFGLAALVGTLRRWPGRRGLLGDGAVLLTTGTIGFVAIALSSWVVLNSLHPRYLVPIYVLSASLGALSILYVSDRLAGVERSRAALVLCAAALAFAGCRGLPPVPAGDGIVDAAARPFAAAVAAEVARLRLDGVAGDYWTVWPAVFLAEQHAHDAGEPAGRVFGIGERGVARREALQARLLERGELTVACLDRSAEECRTLAEGTAGVPLRITGISEVRQPPSPGHRIGALRLVPAGADGGS